MMSPQDFKNFGKCFWRVAISALALIFLLGAMFASAIVFILRM